MHAEITFPDVSAVAEEAYVLAYPLVLTSLSMAQATAVPAPDPASLRAPLNTLVHGRDTPDTLRSAGWLDLAPEPIVLSVPDTHGRYYVLWLRDAWDTVFASVGARTCGTERHSFAVLGPGDHEARLPAGVRPVVANTRTVRVTGCIEAVGATDEDALREAGEGFGLLPLSGRGGAEPPHPLAGSHRDPVAQVERMDAFEFFSEVAQLVRDNPPDPACRAVLERLDELAPWHVHTSMRAEIEHGVDRGRASVRAEATRPPEEVVGRWRIFDGLRRPGADPLRRAAALRAGRSAEPASDTLRAFVDCDDSGQPLSGRSRYLLRFGPDATPPVFGFWSLTADDGTGRGAHATGDLRGLVLDRDGSLAIHIQHRSPGRTHRSNWLRTPSEDFKLTLHLYWPREEALERRWSPPPVIRVE